MKEVFILFYFIFAGTFCCGQKLSLQFRNKEGLSVGFVTIYDSLHSIYRAADGNGAITLPANNYTFTFKHVSYNTTRLTVLSIFKDTLIVITLVPRLTDLEPVKVVGKNVYENKIYETGTFSENSDSHKVLNQNLKLGIVSPQIPSANISKLVGIKFKLDNLPDLRSADYVIEVKLYKIHNHFISTIPINTIPIFIHANQLHKKNTVKFQEWIPIDSAGIFISFEIPKVTPANNFTIHFPGSFTGNNCQAFVISNSSVDWPDNIIQTGCTKIPYTDQYFIPELSVLYKRKSL